jgi:hypothetical protein
VSVFTDKEVKWLQMKLDEFLSPLNKSYFSQLWSKFGRDWAPAPYNIHTFLLDMMQNGGFSDESNRKAAKLFQDVENKENLFLFSVSKVCLMFFLDMLLPTHTNPFQS